MTEQTMTTRETDGAAGRGLGTLCARVLRGLGATVLVASLSVFLFQGWSDAGDLGRFGLLLAQTVLLVAAGLTSGHWLREPKGARVFVAIALVAVTANFAVLGGLIHSQYGAGELTAGAPDALVWQAASGAWALGATAGALAVLGPVVRLGLAVLARPAAGMLTGLYLANAATLLVPVRDALAVAVLAAVALGATLAVARRLVPREPGLRTFEGLLALGLPVLPIGVLAGRGVLFYPDPVVLLAISALGIQALLRETARHVSGRARLWLERAAIAWSLPAGAITASAISVMTPVPATAWLPLAGLTTAGLLLEIGRNAERDTVACRIGAAAVAAIATSVNVLAFDGVGVSVLALAVGIATTGCAYLERQPWLLAPAAVAGLIGLGNLVHHAVGTLEIGAWGWLAVIGVVTVVAGSLVERRDLLRRVAIRRETP